MTFICTCDHISRRTTIHPIVLACMPTLHYAARSLALAHTDLLRTTIANFDVECILRAKTLPLHLTGLG